MVSVNSAAHRIDVTTQQLQGTIAKALAPDAHGRCQQRHLRRDALKREVSATANMTEDTEALKHRFLFRGYFKKHKFGGAAGTEIFAKIRLL